MTTDPLGSLGDRDGWTAAEGGGWRNAERDITVQQVNPFRFRVTAPGAEWLMTTATGALCIVDQILVKTAE